VTRIAAHRGGAALWPENSLLAFQSAIALGSDLLEFDVHLTRDRAVAVIHDATLERTTDGTGPVASVTAADLHRLRLRGPDKVFTAEHVPTLDEVLAVASAAPVPVGLLVEVKEPAAGARYEGLEELILAALTRVGLQTRATLMAFDPHAIARVRELAPRAHTTILVDRAGLDRAGARPAQILDWAAAAGVTDLGLEYTLVDERLVAAAHAANLALGVWTVNEPASIQRMLDLGVDIITSDRPDLAKRLQRGGRR
jgi:glycerophosphoryl diester phosphodiesterase